MAHFFTCNMPRTEGCYIISKLIDSNSKVGTYCLNPLFYVSLFSHCLAYCTSIFDEGTKSQKLSRRKEITPACQAIKRHSERRTATNTTCALWNEFFRYSIRNLGKGFLEFIFCFAC